MNPISVEAAATQLPALIQQVLAGGEIILTQDGRPVAKLAAVAEEAAPVRREFGSMKGQITIADDFDAPLADFAEYQ